MAKSLSKATVCLAALLSFVACAPVSYQEPKPEEGPVAKVRFATSIKNAVTVVWQFDDNQCTGSAEMFRLRNGFLVNSVEKTLGMPGDEFREEAAKEVLIPADKPFYGMFLFESTTKIGRRCASLVEYDFKDGGLYELYFAKQGRHCQTDLSEFVTEGDGYKRQSRKIFDHYFTGSACEAKLTDLIP